VVMVFSHRPLIMLPWLIVVHRKYSKPTDVNGESLLANGGLTGSQRTPECLSIPFVLSLSKDLTDRTAENSS